MRKSGAITMAVIVAVLTFWCTPSSAKSAYRADGTCDGLPRAMLKTPAGFCVGIVAEGLKFPRGIQPLPDGDLLVVDMGGWTERRGTVWRLTKTSGGYTKQVLLQKLDRPHGIAIGPDGLIYVGEVGRLFRFDLRNPANTMTDVVGGKSGIPALPVTGRHLLTSFVFDKAGDIYVNVGSQTDHCEKEDGTAPSPDQPCPEAEGGAPRAAIRKYTMRWPAGTVRVSETYARGLRNSVALAVHPATGELWQGENSRDAIQQAMPELKNDNDLPHDELNLIRRGAHHGWPQCYDDNLASPEYPETDCAVFRKPARLLPAHAAPLGMTFYQGRQFPSGYANSLIVSFHGYRQHGHRVVALMPDAAGAPLGKSVDLISDWGATDTHPMGAPVDVKVAADGAIYLTEDRNGTVLTLRYVGARLNRP